MASVLQGGFAMIRDFVDGVEYRAFCLSTCLPTVAPDQFCRDGFTERFDHGLEASISVNTGLPIFLACKDP